MRTTAAPACRTLAAVALAVLFSAPAPAAEEPVPEPITLRIPVAPARPVRFVFTLATRQTARGGPAGSAGGSIVTKFVYEIALEVERASGAGGLEGMASFGRIQSEFDLGPPGKFELDSTRPLPAEGFGRIIGMSAHAFAGARLPASFHRGGAIEGVKDRAAWTAARSKEWGLDAAESLAVSATVTDRSFLDTINAALFITPVPEVPLRPGHAWRDAEVLPGISKGKVGRLEHRFKIDAIEKDEVVVAGEGSVDIRSAAPPGSKEPGRSVVKTSTVESRTRLSRADGWPVAARLKYTFDGEEAGRQVRQETTYDLERVEEWPSVAAKNDASRKGGERDAGGGDDGKGGPSKSR
jgi:hypothetical protein